jgi:hypothetical protein
MGNRWRKGMEFPERFTKDFIKRTKVNLEFVQKAHAEKQKARAKEQKVFEVTQLINSMLGLLVFPRTEFDDEIDCTKTLDTFRHEQDGWEIPETTKWPEPKKWKKAYHWKCLREYVRHMRNGLAHQRIEFHSNNNKELSGMTIWDQHNEKSKTRNWEVKFTTIKQLREFTEGMTKYFLELAGSRPEQRVDSRA